MVVPLWQLSVSSQHMVKSLTLNPYMSLCNLKLTETPLTFDFLVRLGLNFHPTGEFGGGGRGIGLAGDIFFLSRTDRNVTT